MSVSADNWTVSTDDDARHFPAASWGVYRRGQLVSGGWASSADARWALGYYERGETPPWEPRPEHRPGYRLAV